MNNTKKTIIVSRPAYSLIFAFVMMTLIMLVASTSIEDTRAKLQLFRDLEASSQARLAAESAAELGIVELKASNYSAGSEAEAFCVRMDNEKDDYEMDDYGEDMDFCKGSATYSLYPYAEKNSKDVNGYYFLPIPGTGNAAPSEECSILDEDKDPDNSCNWNKLMPGITASLPLYYDDGEGNISIPMNTASFTSWTLKLRTPCKNGDTSQNCDDTGSGSAGERYRFEHNDSASDNENGNDTLKDENRTMVYWTLTGYDSEGKAVISVLPDDCVWNDLKIYLDTRAACLSNTEIYETLINDEVDAGTFEVLGSDFNSTLNEDIDFNAIETFFLNLNIVNTLVDENGDTIPYLEYQLVLDSDTPFIAAKPTALGKGYYESGGKTYYFSYTLSYSRTSEFTNLYTLSN